MNVFNLKTGINESEIIAKLISCKCKCKFDSRKCNSNQKWSNDKCRCKCKNLAEHHACKQGYIWNRDICTFENGRYARSVIDDSMIMYVEIVKETKALTTKSTSTKTVPTNFNEKKVTCKTP